MLKIADSAFVSNASERLAMEANTLSNMVDSVVAFLPSIFSGVASTFSGFNKVSDEVKFAGNTAIDNLTRRENNLLAELARTEFDDMTNFGVPVGVGFKGSLIDYADTVSRLQTYYQEDTAKHLQEFYVYMSVLVSNKDARLSLKDQSRVYKGIETERKQFDAQVQSFFGTSQSNTVQYTKGAKSHTEFGSYLSKLTSICRIDDKRSRQAVSDLIEKISVVCDTLIKQAKDGTITNLTPEVTKNIHEGMLTMAKLVESYGLFLHRRTELVASREQLIEKLEKRL